MIFIKQIRSQDDEKDYFIISSFQDGDGDIEIAVLSVLNFKSYNGMLSNDYVKKRSVKMRMSYKTYLTETRSALAHSNLDGLEFEYNVTEIENDCVLFEWKKHVEEAELTVVLGSVILSLFATAELVTLIFSKLATELQYTYCKIEDLAADQNRLKAEREDLLGMLKETNEWKTKLEAEMYAKFVVVLNSKKEKIRELTDQLEKHKDGNVEKNAMVRTNKLSSENINSDCKKIVNNSLDIFSDEELVIPCSSRSGRFISSNQPSKKKMKLETTAKNEDHCRKPLEHDGTSPASDAGSDELFDEL